MTLPLSPAAAARVAEIRARLEAHRRWREASGTYTTEVEAVDIKHFTDPDAGGWVDTYAAVLAHSEADLHFLLNLLDSATAPAPPPSRLDLFAAAAIRGMCEQGVAACAVKDVSAKAAMIAHATDRALQAEAERRDGGA